jgi:hypothetical protein
MNDSAIMAIGAVLLTGLAVTQVPAYQARQAQIDANGAEARQQMQITAQNDAMATAEAEESKTANARYAGHCEPIQALRADDAAPIRNGEPIVAGAYAATFNAANPDPSKYLGDGVNVCDFFGKTATMEFDARKDYAVANRVAVTHDESVIGAFRKKHSYVKIKPFQVGK